MLVDVGGGKGDEGGLQVGVEVVWEMLVGFNWDERLWMKVHSEGLSTTKNKEMNVKEVKSNMIGSRVAL